LPIHPSCPQPASGAQPISFSHAGAGVQPKRNPRQGQGVSDLLIKPWSLGVRNAAVGQSRLSGSASHFLLVVLLAAIGQGHLRFLRNPAPRSLAWWSAPRRSEVNVVSSGCYRLFLREASTPVSFGRIHSEFLVAAPLRAFTSPPSVVMSRPWRWIRWSQPWSTFESKCRRLHRNPCPISRYWFHAAGSGRPLRENHISSQFNEPKRNPPAADGFGQTEAQTTFPKTDRSEWLRVSPEKTVSAGGNRRRKAGCGSRAPTSPQAGTASGVIDVWWLLVTCW